MYQASGALFPSLALLWPALAAATASELSGSFARQLAELAVGPQAGSATCEPAWTTPNTIVLELKTVHLREFGRRTCGAPTIVCAPLALHGAAIADLAPGHSLIAALLDSGLSGVFLTDWQSARADMRFLGIDDYLADLNVLVDHVGSPVDLIGLCQGGWMALLYAARFPAKVGKLVLAGAPVHIAAAKSAISTLADAVPMATFRELVKLGDGCVPGGKVLKFWGPEALRSDEIHVLLQSTEAIDSPAFRQIETRFRNWYAWTLDLPGTYYLEVIDKLFKRNELATGHLVALGRSIDLSVVRTPMFLLAGRDDELVAPAQLFGAGHLVGTPASMLRKELADCRHLGLFMSKMALRDCWPRIVSWLIASVCTAAGAAKARRARGRQSDGCRLAAAPERAPRSP